MSVLVRGGHVAGRGRADVRVDAGIITEMADSLSRLPGEEVIEAAGGEVLPGLHDHHVHLRAWAAAAGSVQAGPPAVRDRTGLARALTAGPPGRWVRAVGYHQSVAGPLDRWELDRLCPDRPVRVQHRSGALWVLNSAALERLGLDRSAPPGVERGSGGEPTGRIWREDEWLRDRVPRVAADLGRVSRLAAARGVTGFTDATPGLTADAVGELRAAVESGRVGQRLCVMAPLGADTGGSAWFSIGPVKVILDDARLPGLGELASTVRAAHDTGRRVAVHCVTYVQAALTLAAIADAGPRPGDRIEHGALLGPDMIAEARRLGVTVVTQPGFVRERGDRYLSDVDPADMEDLWRLASLLRAGVGVAAGTDSPFGPADPWVAVRAATDRLTGDGVPLGTDESVPAGTAVQLWHGSATEPTRPRTIRAGAVADLCILAEPLGTGLSRLPEVTATMVAGRRLDLA